MVDYGEPFFATDEEYRQRLREPFPPEQIGQLPRTQKRPELDFVGHAAVTDRLNQVAPDWNYTVDVQFSSPDEASFWVRGTMTIGGITRVEFGDGDDPKEAIGNFIRRAAMRFGVAIDLWSRQELSGSVDRKSAGSDADVAYGEGATTGAGGSGPDPGPPVHTNDTAPILSSQVRALLTAAEDLRWGADDITAAVAEAYPGLTSLRELNQEQARELIPLWQRLARSVRLTNEQVAEVKTLATLADAKKVAEQLLGRKVSSLHDLTVTEGNSLIEALQAVVVAGRAAP